MKMEPIDTKPAAEEWTRGSSSLPISLLSSSEPADSDSSSASSSSDSDMGSDNDSVPETDSESDSESESDMNLDSESDELDEVVKEEVKLELNLPTDIPLPAPPRPGNLAVVGDVKMETEEDEDVDRTRVDDMLDLDVSSAQATISVAPALQSGVDAPAAIPVGTLPSVLQVRPPVSIQPRPETAPRPAITTDGGRGGRRPGSPHHAVHDVQPGGCGGGCSSSSPSSLQWQPALLRRERLPSAGCGRGRQAQRHHHPAD